MSSTGLYTAPRRTGGPYTITASAGGVKGTGKVTVVAQPAAGTRTKAAQTQNNLFAGPLSEPYGWLEHPALLEPPA